MKKLLATVLCTSLLLTGCGGSGASADQKKLQKELESSVSMTWMGDVRNDKTGKWKLAECATSKDVTEYALQYYEAYFEADDEIHAVVNFSLNTTNKITVAGDDLLIDVYDYVDGEEHDAAELFSGERLKTETIGRK